jgi:hypothetical protein
MSSACEDGMCPDCANVSVETLCDERSKFKKHRNTWRRIAFRLYDELKKHDVMTAEEIFRSDDEPTQRQGTETEGSNG